jgi:hypothetical protein
MQAGAQSANQHQQNEDQLDDGIGLLNGKPHKRMMILADIHVFESLYQQVASAGIASQVFNRNGRRVPDTMSYSGRVVLYFTTPASSVET